MSTSSQTPPPSTPVSFVSLSEEQFARLINGNGRSNQCITRPTRRLPIFNGDILEDPRSFLHTCEAVFHDNDTDPVEWVSIAQDQLKNQAATYWSAFRRLPHTWQQFTDRLLRKYDNDDVHGQLAIEFYSTPQMRNQSIEVFILVLRSKGNLSISVVGNLLQPIRGHDQHQLIQMPNHQNQ